MGAAAGHFEAFITCACEGGIVLSLKHPGITLLGPSQDLLET